jgi:hypothetical protein
MVFEVGVEAEIRVWISSIDCTRKAVVEFGETGIGVVAAAW